MINIVDKIRSSDADISGEAAKQKLTELLGDQRFVWFTSAGGNLIQTAQLADTFVYKLAGVETPAGFIATPQPMNILNVNYEEGLVTKALVYANGVVVLIEGLQQEMIVLIDRATCEALKIPYNVINFEGNQEE